MQKGLITDTFTPVLRDKFAKFPSAVIGQTKPGDDMEQITADILKFIEMCIRDSYYMEEEFLEHPGIADGKVSDLDLLAAVCDAEAVSYTHLPGKQYSEKNPPPQPDPSACGTYDTNAPSPPHPETALHHSRRSKPRCV